MFKMYQMGQFKCFVIFVKTYIYETFAIAKLQNRTATNPIFEVRLLGFRDLSDLPHKDFTVFLGWAKEIYVLFSHVTQFFLLCLRHSFSRRSLDSGGVVQLLEPPEALRPFWFSLLLVFLATCRDHSGEAGASTHKRVENNLAPGWVGEYASLLLLLHVPSKSLIAELFL